MHDLKNIFLAWVSSAPTFMAVIDSGSVFTIITAIVLPTAFFLLGKAMDVGLQIYFRRRSLDKPQRRGDAGRKT